MNWLAKHILLFHVAAFVIALGWIHGGTRPEWLLPVIPWMSLVILEWFLLCAQPKKDELLLDSRERVWSVLKKDYLVHIALAFTVLLVIPFFNIAKEPVFVEATQKWQAFAPPIKWLPFTTDIHRHAVVLLWFIPAMIAVLAVKHGLLKRSKRILLEIICWNGAALALLGFVQLSWQTDSILWMTKMEGEFFSVFGYVNLGAAYFTLIGAISFGLWLQQAAEDVNLAAVSTLHPDELQSAWRVHRMVFPTLLCFAGAIATLSRAGIILCFLLFVFFVIYGLGYIWKRIDLGVRISILSGVSAFIFILVVLFFALRLEGLKRELATITWSAVIERVTGSGQYHVRVAKEIASDYPIFGVGGWGYEVYQGVYLTPEEAKGKQVVGGSNVHNDMFQFLAEHGIIGFGLMMAFALGVVIPLLLAVIRFCKLKPTGGQSSGSVLKTHWFYRLPPVIVAIFAGTTATVAHSFGDLPFRSPAILVIWLLAFVCATGWLPAIKK